MVISPEKQQTTILAFKSLFTQPNSPFDNRKAATVVTAFYPLSFYNHKTFMIIYLKIKPTLSFRLILQPFLSYLSHFTFFIACQLSSVLFLEIYTPKIISGLIFSFWLMTRATFSVGSFLPVRYSLIQEAVLADSSWLMVSYPMLDTGC